MKILWVVNTIFPDLARYLSLPAPVFGGWMYGLATDLATSNNITLAVVTVYSGSDMKSFAINGIRYYLIPNNKNKIKNGVHISEWTSLISEFKPDIVHIHGTEYGHGMDLMNARPNLRYVVSIQGLVSVYHRYFLAGMTMWEVLRNITFRDIVRRNTLFHAKCDFFKRGLIEKEYIRRATIIIGRTDWDHAHAWAVNPKINYQFCNESLRDEFYSGEKWSLQSCHRNSIFLSQAAYPIKGLHQVLKAVSLLKDKYPDILIKVAGPDVTDSSSLRAWLKRTGYGSYIASLIKNLNLEKHIVFLGQLNAEEMKIAYLNAHVFICPSSIENSPNSLGEAQILGVPCISSYSGGIPSMIGENQSGILYRFDEFEMLARKIDEIFTREKIFNTESIKKAETRHDRVNVKNKLIEIYKTM